MPYQNTEPGPSVGESSGFGSGIAAGGNAILDFVPTRTTTKIDQTKQTVLSQEAIDQLIYSALSGNSGISAIKTGEASSGGYGSSSAALQSADLIAAVAGQIGEMTGPKVNQSETTTKKKKSVICTMLADAGLMDRTLYEIGQVEFQTLDPDTILGPIGWLLVFHTIRQLLELQNLLHFVDIRILFLAYLLLPVG